MKVLLATTMVLGVMFTLSASQTSANATVLQPFVSAKSQNYFTPARYYYYGPGPGYYYNPAPAYYYDSRPFLRIGPIGIF